MTCSAGLCHRWGHNDSGGFTAFPYGQVKCEEKCSIRRRIQKIEKEIFLVKKNKQTKKPAVNLFGGLLYWITVASYYSKGKYGCIFKIKKI